MASIRNLKDPSGSVFYPLTHERAVKDSNGVSLESKLEGLESKTYVEAWDGASTPVVANIPAGVTVTYNTTTYTGTLAASSSTIGKIYLVKNGNDYDRYITSQSGSSYSWSSIGTTELDLSGYATDAELNQLEANIQEDVMGVLRIEKSSVSNWTNYFSISGKAGIKYSFLLNCDAASSNKNVGIGASVSDTSYASVTMPTGGKGARVEYTPSSATVLYFNTYGSMTNVKAEVFIEDENISTVYNTLYPSYVATQETFSWQKLNLVNGVFDSAPTITPTTTRLCFPVVFTIEDFIEAKVGNNSYYLSVKIFDADGQPMSAYNLGWVKQYSLDKDAVLAGARFIAVNFRRTDDGSITPEEGNLLLHIRDGFSFNELYKEIKAIPRGVSFTSQGGINANNTLLQFEVLANIVCVISGVNYIIPRGTTVEYQYLLDTLCFLIFDKENLTLAIKKRADVSAEDIIFSNIVTPAGKNRVISLPSCPVDWFIDGVSPYNKASESPGVPYYGESIKLNFFRLGDPKNYALTWMQSMVIDGENILVFDNLNNDARARLIDATSGNIKMEESIPHGSYPAPHCNTACLGGQKNGANSVMPLVYLSMWGTGANRVCFVFDVVKTNDIYSISLVQVLDFSGIPSSLIGEGNCDFAVDSLNGFIYSIAYKTSNATDATNNATMICKFALPSAGSSTVSFTETDILDHFELPYVFMRQDLFVNNGNIYLASGGDDDDSARAKRIISVISPERKAIVSKMYLSDVGFVGEPEGFDIYKNKMYISDTAGSMCYVFTD